MELVDELAVVTSVDGNSGSDLLSVDNNKKEK
jgi:hypothetical protein